MFGNYSTASNSLCGTLNAVLPRWTPVNDVEASPELTYAGFALSTYAYPSNGDPPIEIYLYIDTFNQAAYDQVTVGQGVLWGGSGYTLYPNQNEVTGKGYDSYNDIYYVGISSEQPLIFASYYEYGTAYFYNKTTGPNWTPIVAQG